jgi:hypothetical protein
MGALALGIKAFIDGLHAGPGIANTDIQDAITPIYGAIAFDVDTTDDVFRNADHESQIAANAGTDAGNQVGQIGKQLDQITRHTYDTVIPGSMSWLRGDLLVHYIQPIRHDIGLINGRIRAFDKFEKAIDDWKTHTVTPAVNSYYTFRKWFDGWPTQVLAQWHDWFQQPGNFATWAVPILTRPMLTYLGNGQHPELVGVLAVDVLDGLPDQLGPLIQALGAIAYTPVPDGYGP